MLQSYSYSDLCIAKFLQSLYESPTSSSSFTLNRTNITLLHLQLSLHRVL